jgi:hypothetical protein
MDINTCWCNFYTLSVYIIWYLLIKFVKVKFSLVKDIAGYRGYYN